MQIILYTENIVMSHVCLFLVEYSLMIRTIVLFDKLQETPSTVDLFCRFTLEYKSIKRLENCHT